MPREPFREEVYRGPAEEAVLVQLALEREGIGCIVVPMTMRGPLRLAVYVTVESQLARARTIVTRHDKGASPSEAAIAAPWTCRSCGEEVEGQFQECWNCGASRR